MHIQSSISAFESTLHALAKTPADLTAYATEANGYCQNDNVSVGLRNKWNREFVKTMLDVELPENYKFMWVPPTGYIAPDDGGDDGGGGDELPEDTAGLVTRTRYTGNGEQALNIDNNSLFTLRGVHNGRGYYNLEGTEDNPVADSFSWDGSRWVYYNVVGTGLMLANTNDVAYPWLATGWTYWESGGLLFSRLYREGDAPADDITILTLPTFTSSAYPVVVGVLLTASSPGTARGEISQPNMTNYRWYLDSTLVSTEGTYSPVLEDFGKTIALRVEWQNEVSTLESGNGDSASIDAVLPVVNTYPNLNNSGGYVGQATLSVDDGQWGGTVPMTFTYQHYCNGSPAGTEKSFVPNQAGDFVCDVTAVNIKGSVTVRANNTATIQYEPPPTE